MMQQTKNRWVRRKVSLGAGQCCYSVGLPVLAAHFLSEGEYRRRALHGRGLYPAAATEALC